MTHPFHRALSITLCAPLTLSLLSAPLQAYAQAEPAPAPLVMSAAQAPPLPDSTSPAETAALPAAIPAADPGPAAIAGAATVSPPPLRVIYSYVGADQTRVKPIMDDLRVIHPKNTQNNVAAQVALNVALIALSGGLALGVQGFGKQDLSGAEPDGLQNKVRVRNPGLEQLPADLQQRATAWLDANEKTHGKSFTQPLVVNAATWKLVYNSLDSADNTYKLHFDAQIYKLRDKPSFITGNRRPATGCAFATDARPLADWAANDYQAVADAMPQAIAQCSSEFVAQLPKLLELE